LALDLVKKFSHRFSENLILNGKFLVPTSQYIGNLEIKEIGGLNRVKVIVPPQGMAMFEIKQTSSSQPISIKVELNSWIRYQEASSSVEKEEEAAASWQTVVSLTDLQLDPPVDYQIESMHPKNLVNMINSPEKTLTTTAKSDVITIIPKEPIKSIKWNYKLLSYQESQQGKCQFYRIDFNYGSNSLPSSIIQIE